MRPILAIFSSCLMVCSTCFAQQKVCTATELQNAINSKISEPIELNIVFPACDSRALFFDSPDTDRDARRAMLINHLEEQAKLSQADVLAYLKGEEAKGNVKNIESFWISNSITCQANINVADNLSMRSDITHLGLNNDVQLLNPENIEVIEPSAKSRAGGSVVSHISQINADDVWDLGYTGKNIVVAIIDSGTNIDHYDIRNHLWRGYIDTDNDGISDSWVNGWNFVTNSSNIVDDYSHGSHCAGIVAGDGNSGMKSGVAPDAQIMTLKTVNRAGGGSPANMIKAVEFALKNGADVISMSLGFKNSQIDDATKAALRKTFENTLAIGVVACAAVGNDGNKFGAPNNVDVPASCPPPYLHPDQKAVCNGGLTSIISVGSVDSNDNYVSSSSSGPSMWNITIDGQYQYNDYPYDGESNLGLIRPDICAPGELIISLNHNLNNKYTLMSGTSMATPCVAGVIALMLEKNPDLTPGQICEILETTASKISESKNNYTGSGRIDALAAINAVSASNSTPYVRLTEYPTNEFTPGDNQTLTITITNSGHAAWNDGTVTLKTDDPYITIIEDSQIVSIDARESANVNFPINISAETPNGYVAYIDATTTNGHTDRFRLVVNVEATIGYKSYSPSKLQKGKNETLTITVQNIGNIATTSDTKLILSSTVTGVNIISAEATIGPLEVNATATCSFVVNILNEVEDGDIKFMLQSIPDNYTKTSDLIYQFEINPNDPVYDDGFCYWTTFDNNTDYWNAAWPFWHSSLAKKNALTNVGEFLHSGESHMISEAFCAATYLDPENTIPTDNFLVSPKIKATADSKFTFWARCHPKYTYPGEHFGVAISENSNKSASDFTMVQEWTTEGSAWKKYSIDLSAYAGKEIYVAIRHFYTQEQWIAADYGYNYYTLNIDDATFENVINASFIFLDKNCSVFRIPIATAGIDNVSDGKANVTIQSINKQIIVNNICGDATINIFDVYGRNALTHISSASETIIDADNLQSGIYIVQVTDLCGTITCKVKL